MVRTRRQRKLQRGGQIVVGTKVRVRPHGHIGEIIEIIQEPVFGFPGVTDSKYRVQYMNRSLPTEIVAPFYIEPIWSPPAYSIGLAPAPPMAGVGPYSTPAGQTSVVVATKPPPKYEIGETIVASLAGSTPAPFKILDRKFVDKDGEWMYRLQLSGGTTGIKESRILHRYTPPAAASGPVSAESAWKAYTGKVTSAPPATAPPRAPPVSDGPIGQCARGTRVKVDNKLGTYVNDSTGDKTNERGVYLPTYIIRFDDGSDGTYYGSQIQIVGPCNPAPGSAAGVVNAKSAWAGVVGKVTLAPPATAPPSAPPVSDGPIKDCPIGTRVKVGNRVGRYVDGSTGDRTNEFGIYLPTYIIRFDDGSDGTYYGSQITLFGSCTGAAGGTSYGSFLPTAAAAPASAAPGIGTYSTGAGQGYGFGATGFGSSDGAAGGISTARPDPQYRVGDVVVLRGNPPIPYVLTKRKYDESSMEWAYAVKQRDNPADSESWFVESGIKWKYREPAHTLSPPGVKTYGPIGPDAPVMRYVISAHGRPRQVSYSPPDNFRLAFFTRENVILDCPNVLQTIACLGTQDWQVAEWVPSTRSTRDYLLSKDTTVGFLSGAVDCQIPGSKEKVVKDLTTYKINSEIPLSEVVNAIETHHNAMYPGRQAIVYCLFCRGGPASKRVEPGAPPRRRKTRKARRSRKSRR